VWRRYRTRQAIEEAGDGSQGETKEVEDPIELAAIFFNRAVVYCHVGDDNSAYEDLTSAIKRDPSNHIFKVNRALVSRRFGNYADSTGDYVKLWMERRLNNLDTFPNEFTERPRTMSSYKESRHKGDGRAGGAAEKFDEQMRELETQAEPLPSLFTPKNKKMNQAPMNQQGSIETESPFFPLEGGESQTTYDYDGQQTLNQNSLNQPSVDSSLAFKQQPGDLSLDGSGVYEQDSNTLLQSPSHHPRTAGSLTLNNSMEGFESIASVNSMGTPIRAGTVNNTQRPNTTTGASGGRKSTRMMSKMEQLAAEQPPERPVHAMDPRQLTDMFFQVTTKERELVELQLKRLADPGAEESSKGAEQGGKKKQWTDTRIDLNEFKRIHGCGNGDVHEEIFQKPSELQVMARF